MPVAIAGADAMLPSNFHGPQQRGVEVRVEAQSIALSPGQVTPLGLCLAEVLTKVALRQSRLTRRVTTAPGANAHSAFDKAHSVMRLVPSRARS